MTFNNEVYESFTSQPFSPVQVYHGNCQLNLSEFLFYVRYQNPQTNQAIAVGKGLLCPNYRNGLKFPWKQRMHTINKEMSIWCQHGKLSLCSNIFTVRWWSRNMKTHRVKSHLIYNLSCLDATIRQFWNRICGKGYRCLIWLKTFKTRRILYQYYLSNQVPEIRKSRNLG